MIGRHCLYSKLKDPFWHRATAYEAVSIVASHMKAIRA
jgi:hypothetical protein